MTEYENLLQETIATTILTISIIMFMTSYLTQIHIQQAIPTTSIRIHIITIGTQSTPELRTVTEIRNVLILVYIRKENYLYFFTILRKILHS